MGTVYDPYNPADNFPLLSTAAEDSYNPYFEYAQPSPMLPLGATMSGNHYSHEQNSAIRLQYREREGNDVSLSDSASHLKSPSTSWNWIDHARHHTNTVSSPVSASMSSAPGKKQQDSGSNVASGSSMNSEVDIDVVKLKQVAPARYDTVADASQAVDQKIGIDADGEDATSTERRITTRILPVTKTGSEEDFAEFIFIMDVSFLNDVHRLRTKEDVAVSQIVGGWQNASQVPSLGINPLPAMPSKAHQRRSRRAARPLIIRVHDRKAHVHGVLGEFDSNSSEIDQTIETAILEEVKQMSLHSTKNKENEKEEFEMMPESGHLEEWEAVEAEEEDWEELCVGHGREKMSYANALKGKPEG
ncbi:hypothetical protein IW261DRAFT_1423267 [Armillaria novae-zelandiae]|uniref:Uncharacterized protein n=1 Tax=Armillaria novae-zelandiae TaxID=153914 RepID=A0AA39NXX7_9AGAR|nr:hypothetical protein IW261DRAFT_1423267 [Armillaria novae-zelandiae]